MPARRASVPAAPGSAVALSSVAAAASTGGSNVGGLGMLPGGAMSLHESFIYSGAGWQGPANYAVVAAPPPHHRPVCRYSSYPGKQPANGADSNYEDVWACRMAAAAAASAAAASTVTAAAVPAMTAHSPAKSHLPKYLLGGHAPLSRCKTWSPPDVDGTGSRSVLTATVDDAASVSNCSDTSGSSGSTMLATFNGIGSTSRRGGGGSSGGGASVGGVSGGSSSAISAAVAAGAEQNGAGDESASSLSQSGCNDHELQRSPSLHSVPPPRLAPISGFLLPITEKGVLRPVACRPAPAARPNEYVAAPPPPSKLQPPAQPHSAQLLLVAAAAAQPSSAAASSCVDEGYWSRETSRSSCVSSSAAAAVARSNGAPQPPSADGDAGSSGPPSPTSRSPCSATAAYGAVVPVSGGPASRSAAPVAASEAQQRAAAGGAASRELELLAAQSQLLRERESEVDGLRETLERNERAIFAAFDERQASWQRQMRDLSAEYQRRLAAQQERAAKCEASLVAQLQRAQQEADALQEELRLSRTRPDDAELQQQRRPLAAHARGAEHDAVSAAAAGAVARLRLDDAAAGGCGSTRADVADDRPVGAALKRYKEDGKPAAAAATPAAGGGNSSGVGADECSAATARAEAERLRSELERRNCELKALRDGIETERLLWQQEKDKVIQYQKQLQLNYVQMYRKNAQLESELSRLLAAADPAAAAAAAAAGQQQQLPRRDCVTASRGTAPGPSLVLSFADNPESLC